MHGHYACSGLVKGNTCASLTDEKCKEPMFQPCVATCDEGSLPPCPAFNLFFYFWIIVVAIPYLNVVCVLVSWLFCECKHVSSLMGYKRIHGTFIVIPQMLSMYTSSHRCAWLNFVFSMFLSLVDDLSMNITREMALTNQPRHSVLLNRSIRYFGFSINSVP